MSDLPQMNPTGRFTGLAEGYARHRPEYPADAIDCIIKQCGLGLASVLVDVGSGTGIASRQFARRGIPVIGVEPNEEMRRQASRESMEPGIPVPEYRAGRAEATGLPDGTADAVLAAQAFHWFDPEPTLREFHRILKPAGWAVILWNERDEADAFSAAYGKIIRSTPQAALTESGRRRMGEPLLASPLFADGSTNRFTHQQELDEEGMVGRALSVSYAPREPNAVVAFTAALGEVFARFAQNGRVVLQYQTTLVMAKRAG